MSFVEVLGWAAALTVMGISLPQLALLLRTRDTAGLALPTWIINLGTYIGWLSHGIKLGQWPMAIPNVWGLGCTIGILLVLVRVRNLNPIKVLAPGVLLGAAMVGLDYFVASWAFGIMAMVPGCISMGRQGWELTRAPDVSGVSTASWVWQVATQALWMVWGLLVVDWGTIISTFFSVIVAGIVLVLLVARARGWVPAYLAQTFNQPGDATLAA
ncbi:MAG: hypothetical protein LBC29_05460 [Propionibacteriaceae bacterium]|jgi:uncharacterized protein with PQ loop repeat|nr:hypothetical protein [Propionibacteriaceae bacterium]